MTVKEVPVVGWDNGFDFEKIVVGKGKKNRVAFPSRIKVVHGDKDAFAGIGVDEGEKRDPLQDMMVFFEGKEYQVGYCAIRMAERLARDTDDDKFKKSEEKAKLLAGLSYLYPNDKQIRINNLVVGLSLKNTRFRNALQTIYEGETFNFRLPGDTEDRTIHIKKVTVMSQGQGAFINEILDFDADPIKDDFIDARFGVLDYGGKTIDIYIAEGTDPIPGTIHGLPYGAMDTFNTASKNKALNGMPSWMIEKSYFNDEPVIYSGEEYYQEIKKAINEAIGETANDSYNAINEHFERYYETMKFILICGGFAKEFHNQIKDRLPKLDIRIPEDPVYANANGYYKYGYMLHKDQESSATA